MDGQGTQGIAVAEQPVRDFDEAILTKLLREYFDVPEDQLGPEADFESLGLDSLGFMEMVVAMEDQVGVELVARMEGLSPASTLADVTRIVRTALAESPLPGPQGS